MMQRGDQSNSSISDPLASYYTLREHTTSNEARFGISHLYTMLSIMANKTFKNWDEIIPDRLYLGTIPTKLEAEEIRRQIPNLGKVFSIIEPFELNGSVAVTKISIQSPSEWKKMGIGHHLLIVPDFTADVDIRLLHKTLLDMHEQIK